ncbi:MAG: hypothetical protein DRQ24_04245 [Candidatus Latescibacterota bacterium]|nr:MAG: hypothetical protein DRQ24_04245 [Candidatus Latescibacterota bacterium]
MLAEIQRTFKHSAIYSLGNIGTKLIGIVLLPLYTKHITVSEYGLLGILEITIIILSQTLILGQPQAYLRFYNFPDYKERRDSVLFTIFAFLLAIGLLFNLIGQNLLTTLSSLFSKPIEFTLYLRLCFIIVFLRIIGNLFLNVLRAKEKSLSYAAANVIKITIVLGFNIYFVAFAKIGIKGILFSYLIGDGVLFLILIANMICEMAPKFDRKILTTALSFGFPLIFASLASMLLNMGDRYILKLLVDCREVGLYNLGYKVAGILNVFLIQPFSLSFLPIAYKVYGQKSDKRYYSKVLTYFVFVLFWAGLGLAFFGKEIIKMLALNPEYWTAYRVVPYLTLAYIFSGAKSIASLGLYLKRKTNYVAYNLIAAMVLNVALNFLLIPKYRMMGAAVATIISFAVLYVTTYFTANRFYKIPYENLKLLKMLVLATVLFFLSTLTADLNVLPRILTKLGILISFPFLLYLVNFYEKIEIETIKQGFKKITKVESVA